MYFILIYCSLTYCSALRQEFYLPAGRHTGEASFGSALGPNKQGWRDTPSLASSPITKYSGSNQSMFSLDNHTPNVKAITLIFKTLSN